MVNEGTFNDAAGLGPAKPSKARAIAPRSPTWSTWSRYIKKVLEAVFPDLQINLAALALLVEKLMERLAKDCQRLLQSGGRATLIMWVVEAAAMLLIPLGRVKELATSQGYR